MSLPEAKQRELNEQAMAPEKINECILVRELYVSGLQDANEVQVRRFFEKYGEIEDVEIIKNFVFVKYFKVEDASNACADYHNINTTLHNNNHNNNFKIFFADHLKRFNVVSNAPKYENKDHLIPVLYASVRNEPTFINRDYLMSIFCKFGYIRNMEVKKNDLPTQRTYVLVEYETLPQALRAREKMRVNREKLGDRKSEITLLIDNNKITHLYPNISNQIRHQTKKRQTTPSQQQQGQPQQLPQMDSYNFPIYQPQAEPHHEDINTLINFIGEFTNTNAAMEEDGRHADWSGFFTRNKRSKVEVDFFCIHKDTI